MHLFSLLPGVLIGLIYAIQYGNWIFLVAILIGGIGAQLSRRVLQQTLTVELRPGQVRVNEKRVSNWVIFWPRSRRDRVLKLVVAPTPSEMAKALTNALRDSKRGGCPVLGVNWDLEPIVLSVDQSHAHTILIGPTGSGKSLLMRQIALGAQLLVDIDFKGGNTLAGIPTSASLTNLSEDASSFWNELNSELDGREALRKPLTAMFVMVDELAAALNSSTQAAKTLERITSRGRSSGVHLIAATQTTAGIPRSMILNSHHRVLVGQVDPIDRTQLGAKASTISDSSPDAFVLRGEYILNGKSQEFFFTPDATPSRVSPSSRGDQPWAAVQRINPLGKAKP